jgi:hypothetical protein
MYSFVRLLAAVGVLCLPFSANACDICGCSGGGSNSLGLLSLTSRHFVGFKVQTQAFYSDAHGSEPNSTELFSSIDLWGRWQPHRRIQIIGSLPYLSNQRQFDTGKTLKINGLGDAAVMGYYTVLSNFRRMNHTLQIGTGLKIPTGKSTLLTSNPEDTPIPPAFQPGTGSTDVQVAALYAFRLGKWGGSTDATYRFAGKNAADYHFGNRLNASIRGFYRITKGKTTAVPYLAGLIDWRDQDATGGVRESDTGGWATFGMLGVEVFSGKIAINIGCQLPVASKMSNGRVTPQTRLNASAVLLFGGKRSKISAVPPAIFQDVKPPSHTTQ